MDNFTREIKENDHNNYGHFPIWSFHYNSLVKFHGKKNWGATT